MGEYSCLSVSASRFSKRGAASGSAQRYISALPQDTLGRFLGVPRNVSLDGIESKINGKIKPFCPILFVDAEIVDVSRDYAKGLSVKIEIVSVKGSVFIGIQSSLQIDVLILQYISFPTYGIDELEPKLIIQLFAQVTDINVAHISLGVA